MRDYDALDIDHYRLILRLGLVLRLGSIYFARHFLKPGLNLQKYFKVSE